MSYPPCHNLAKNVNNYGLSHRNKTVTNCFDSETPGDHVKFYAHTAEGNNGEALKENLRNVANLAKRFAASVGDPPNGTNR